MEQEWRNTMDKLQVAESAKNLRDANFLKKPQLRCNRISSNPIAETSGPLIKSYATDENLCSSPKMANNLSSSNRSSMSPHKLAALGPYEDTKISSNSHNKSRNHNTSVSYDSPDKIVYGSNHSFKSRRKESHHVSASHKLLNDDIEEEDEISPPTLIN
jgi:hypothetical protein